MAAIAIPAASPARAWLPPVGGVWLRPWKQYIVGAIYCTIYCIVKGQYIVLSKFPYSIYFIVFDFTINIFYCADDDTQYIVLLPRRHSIYCIVSAGILNIFIVTANNRNIVLLLQITIQYIGYASRHNTIYWVCETDNNNMYCYWRRQYNILYCLQKQNNILKYCTIYCYLILICIDTFKLIIL